MMRSRSRSASAFGRWKLLRPMMLPNPPPSRIADLLVHGQPVLRSRIDSEADRGAAEPQRVLYAAGDGLVGISLAHRHIVVVHFENKRDVARKLPCARLQKAERRGVRVTSRL